MSVRRYAVAFSVAGMAFTGLHTTAGLATGSDEPGRSQARSTDAVCDDDGVTVDVTDVDFIDVTFTAITVDGIDAECAGAYLLVEVLGQDGDSLGASDPLMIGEDPAEHGGTLRETATFSTALDVGAAYSVRVAIVPSAPAPSGSPADQEDGNDARPDEEPGRDDPRGGADGDRGRADRVDVDSGPAPVGGVDTGGGGSAAGS